MALQDLVIRSQLVPPRQRRGVLRRPRLDAKLAAVLDFPLTLVQADTGYGKSTTLATLADLVDRLCWYTITEPDRDPLLFLAHLVCAFEREQPAWSEAALRLIEERGGRVTPDALTPLLNALTLGLDEDAILVLDDYHLVADVPEIAGLVERLVDYRPPALHVVISSRRMPALGALTRWRVKGQVGVISRDDLAFTASEIEALFREQYGHPLSPAEAQALAVETEGWAIALQMVWQSLQSGAVPDLKAVGVGLGPTPSTPQAQALFDYLAQDVLAKQPADVQRFLLTTSVLREMDGASCDSLLRVGGGPIPGVQDSARMLRRLHEGGLFVVSLGDEVYRYHRLFHDFLRDRLDKLVAEPLSLAGEQFNRLELHRRAAAYYEQVGHPEETIYHLLEALEYRQAVLLLEKIGPELVRLGRFDSLNGWIARVPQEVQQEHPALYLLTGDVLRLRSQFDEALERYAAAETCYAELGDRLGRSRALRGQAQVYLDTVRPLKADSLLEEALRLLEPQEHRGEAAALFEQLAENKLNQGLPDQARALHHEAGLLRDELDPGGVYLEARAMVRTGRLAEAQWLLERRLEDERRADSGRGEPGGGSPRPQRFHRETALLLSLAFALQGDAQAAGRLAREGIRTGQRLNSAYVEAVGFMRLGHAIQLSDSRAWDGAEEGPLTPAPPERGRGLGWRGGGWQRALACYHKAIELVRPFRVMRVQVEPLWGLCRAHGCRGDWEAAERFAAQALAIAEPSGDEWMGQLIRVTAGAACALAHRSEPARQWLDQAAEGFARVGDRFGQSAAWLWKALDAWWQGEADEALDILAGLLRLVREHAYGFLLTRRTTLGLQDDQSTVPLLLEARRRGVETETAGRLLSSMGLEEETKRADCAGAVYHPGYTLSVRTLGPFGVWRGMEPVTARHWQREKARQLWQLLLTYQGQWLQRDQIVDLLWPHLPPDAAARDFKVALNALNRALEPSRPPGAPPFFVVRRDTAYGLNPSARIVVDAQELARLGKADDIDQLRQAVALYGDDYLPDCLYEDWSAPGRQRLQELFLTTAERLAEMQIRATHWDDAIETCQIILGRDNCWEAAYRLLMRAYAGLGNRAQVHAVFQRCAATLRDELGADPSPATRSLFERLG